MAAAECKRVLITGASRGIGRADLAATPLPADGNLEAFKRLDTDFGYFAGIGRISDALAGTLKAEF